MIVKHLKVFKYANLPFIQIDIVFQKLLKCFSKTADIAFTAILLNSCLNSKLLIEREDFLNH